MQKLNFKSLEVFYQMSNLNTFKKFHTDLKKKL